MIFFFSYFNHEHLMKANGKLPYLLARIKGNYAYFENNWLNFISVFAM